MFTLTVPRLQGQTLPDALHHLPLKLIKQNSYLAIFREGLKSYIIYLSYYLFNLGEWGYLKLTHEIDLWTQCIWEALDSGSIGFWTTLSNFIYLSHAPTIVPVQS